MLGANLGSLLYGDVSVMYLSQDASVGLFLALFDIVAIEDWRFLVVLHVSHLQLNHFQQHLSFKVTPETNELRHKKTCL